MKRIVVGALLFAGGWIAAWAFLEFYLGHPSEGQRLDPYADAFDQLEEAGLIERVDQ